MSSDFAAHGLVLVPAFVALALVVIVPLGLKLLYLDEDARTPAGVGAVAAASLLLPAGWTAAALTLPWLAFSGLQAARALLWAAAFGVRSPSAACSAAAPAFLAFGAGWLSLSRLGVAPMGFGEPIVLLTAMHFHYAGFAASALAAAVIGELSELPPRRVALAGATAAAVIAGPVLLAMGWGLWPPLKLAGAASLALGLLALAGLMARLAWKARAGPSRVFLGVSAASIACGMALALAYALGESSGRTWIDMPRMAAFHGTLNAVGFSLCGMLGMRRKV